MVDGLASIMETSMYNFNNKDPDHNNDQNVES